MTDGVIPISHTNSFPVSVITIVAPIFAVWRVIISWALLVGNAATWGSALFDSSVRVRLLCHQADQNLTYHSAMPDKQLALMAITATLRAVANFAGPFSVYQLLAYIEASGEGAVVRPWFAITISI